MSSQAEKLFVGKMVAGRFYVDRIIGWGSFAWVFHAFEQPSGREAAVKVLYSDEPTAGMRFAREVEVLKSLPDVTNVAQYIDHATTPEGWQVLVLDYVDGISLKEGIKRRPVLPAEQAVSFMIEVCSAFVGLHQLGVAHRDVKPDNILLAKKGGIKLIDFGMIRDAQGLLKHFEEEDPLHRHLFAQELDQQTVAGTPEFMAPEQITDATMENIAEGSTDTWSDVYSLGVILFQLISGRKPYPMNDAPPEHFPHEMLRYMRYRMDLTEESYPGCEGADPALDSVIRKAMRQDPRQRQPDARALKKDLERWVDTGEGIAQGDDSRTMMVSIAEVMRKAGAAGQQAPPLVQMAAARAPSGPSQDEMDLPSLHEADDEDEKTGVHDSSSGDDGGSEEFPAGHTGIFFSPADLGGEDSIDVEIPYDEPTVSTPDPDPEPASAPSGPVSSSSGVRETIPDLVMDDETGEVEQEELFSVPEEVDIFSSADGDDLVLDADDAVISVEDATAELDESPTEDFGVPTPAAVTEGTFDGETMDDVGESWGGEGPYVPDAPFATGWDEDESTVLEEPESVRRLLEQERKKKR